MTPVHITAHWREDWSSASVVNHTIVTDPSIWQPVFDITRQTWSLLNRFRTSQGPWHTNPHKRGLAKSSTCDCSQQQHTMYHIVDTCTLMTFEGGLQLLHDAQEQEDAVKCLESVAIICEMKRKLKPNSPSLYSPCPYSLLQWLAVVDSFGHRKRQNFVRY